MTKELQYKHTGHNMTRQWYNVVSFTWKVQFVYFHVIYTQRSTKGRSSSAKERLPQPQICHPRISFSFKLFAKNFKKRAPILSKRKKNENCHRAERNNPNHFPVISKFRPNVFQEMKKKSIPSAKIQTARSILFAQPMTFLLWNVRPVFTWISGEWSELTVNLVIFLWVIV